MGLKGTLNDLNIVELIQFPYTGRKTGQMTIENGHDRASIFYFDGKAVHAEIGDSIGFEAMVDILGLEKGDFEFIPDKSPEKETIQLDLHQLVMKALKARDERRFAQKKMQDQVESQPIVNEPATVKAQPITSSHAEKSQKTDTKVVKSKPSCQKNSSQPLSTKGERSKRNTDSGDLPHRLKIIADQHRFVNYICILGLEQMSEEIRLEAAYKMNAADDEIYNRIQTSVSALITAQIGSGGDLDRVIMQDEEGIVTLSSVGERRWLLIVASNRYSLGSVSLSVKKIVSQII